MNVTLLLTVDVADAMNLEHHCHDEARYAREESDPNAARRWERTESAIKNAIATATDHGEKSA